MPASRKCNSNHLTPQPGGVVPGNEGMMVKKAADLQPGDVLMWNGKPVIVESVSRNAINGYALKLHTHLTKQSVQADDKFLCADRYTITDFVQAVEAGL